MTVSNMQVLAQIRKWFEDDNTDVLRELLRIFVDTLMGAEADALCGAEYGKRSSERENHRNGYRERRFDTRTGTIDLRIPKLRKGSYFPDWLLEPRKRADRALVNVIAQAWISGVSTRKMDDVVRTLGIEGISKSQVSEMAKSLDDVVQDFKNRPLELSYPYVWLDGMVLKNREGGRVQNVSLVVATGVSEEGYREILAFDVFTEESEAGWTSFLRQLVERGLSGVRLVISDAHPGLKKAIASTLTGASWQRCRTHFVCNLLGQVPKTAQPFVTTLVRTIFAQPDAASVRAQHDWVVEQIEGQFPKAAAMLDDAKEDILAFSAFPKAHWRQIWSNNPLERLNKEIRRRTNVVGIFPNRDSIIRLCGAVLMEQHDDWAVARRYMSLHSLASIHTQETNPPQPLTLNPKEVARPTPALV